MKKICENCGSKLESRDQNFCTICGIQQDLTKQLCIICKRQIDQNWQFCANCGVNLKQINVVER